MSYCTLDDLIGRAGERMIIALTDRGDRASGVIDEDVVARAIADAEAVVNGYLAARHDLAAMEPVPGLVRDLTVSIALWKLHPAAPDAKVEADYRDALRCLREIAQGLVLLAAPGRPAAPGVPVGVRFTERDRPLSAEQLKGYI